jgi:two-component system phosphate regulon sensor histidine kinase PhoR
MDVLFHFLCAVLAVAFFLLWRRDVACARGRERAAQAKNALATQALEAEVSEQERRRRELEEVLAALQDAVIMVDIQKRVRYLNRAALALFEVRIENVLGAQLLEALPSFGLEARVQATLTSAQNSTHEVSLHAPQVRKVLLRVSPVQRGNEVMGALIIVQDLTELRRLERVRRDFVANASHELRTPVANIRAIAETLLDAPEDARLAARFHPQILTEAQRLSRLVNDLLDLARLEKQSEEQTYELPEAVDLVTVIYQVVGQSKYKALELRVAVECEFAADCRRDVVVAGDAAALEQVVFNLLDNALDHTPPGGEITLRVAASTAPERKQFVLTVSDTGVGIPAEDLPRIFERFYRADKVRSRAQGGTGLGLAIAKHIVENHGGQITAGSTPGQGATFTVTLPAV